MCTYMHKLSRFIELQMSHKLNYSRGAVIKLVYVSIYVRTYVCTYTSMYVRTYILNICNDIC